MIRVRDVVLRFDHEGEALRFAAAERLGVEVDKIGKVEVVRKSVDARHKNNIVLVYTVDVSVFGDEGEVLKRCGGDDKVKIVDEGQGKYEMAGKCEGEFAGGRPLVVGSGPAGMFAGLVLAEMGCRPVVIERGKVVGERIKDVNAFWRDGVLNSESNVQFGHGGAGTFSDGKLTTQIKDKGNRCRKVIEEFVRAGAPEEIRYLAKPHIGSDNLIRVVKNICERICELGGDVRFGTKMVGIDIREGKVKGVEVDGGEVIETGRVVLALGHSARDSFEMLGRAGVAMEVKPFSIGVRVEHRQSVIDAAQYGKFAGDYRLGPAEYKLVAHCGGGRSAYTFCMCPGGEVVGAASEVGGVVTNGMSFYRRSLENANSALLVGVGAEDFGGGGVLAGMEFQRKWERRAFEVGGQGYFAPVQMVGDFMIGKATKELGEVRPSYRPGVVACDLWECLPGFVVETLREAIGKLDNKLRGFGMYEAVMTAVESRSSSPVRILRDENMQSVNVEGLYPVGEGAGYAGGIISAAVDGIKAAEAVGYGG